MNEKVLGFYEKDSDKFEERLNFPTEITIDENKLVPVRLASESVDLKALKRYCGKNQAKTDMSPKEWVCVKYLIKWAEKEAKKK